MNRASGASTASLRQQGAYRSSLELTTQVCSGRPPPRMSRAAQKYVTSCPAYRLLSYTFLRTYVVIQNPFEVIVSL